VSGPCVVAPHLHAAATAFHAAPAPGAVSARVVEEPPAVVGAGALADAREVAVGEELDRGGHDGPEHATQVPLASPRPAETVFCADERGGSDRVEILVLDRAQIVASRLLAAGDAPEGPVDRGPEPERALEDQASVGRTLLGELEQLGRGRLVQRADVPAPANEIGVVVQEVLRLVVVRPLDRIREMETEPPAEQAREVRCPSIPGDPAILPSIRRLRSKRAGEEYDK
jgi:hypothetical protein